MAGELIAWIPEALRALQVVEHELLLFAGFWFVVGALDEVAVDLSWAWLRLTGRVRTARAGSAARGRALHGPVAVLVPAWQEADVLGMMVAHTLAAWPQTDLRLYVGCYRNDPATLSAALSNAAGDPRLRLVIHDRDGPTTKADCLNRLYTALQQDEARTGRTMHGVVLHDAEDMVHPLALPLIDEALQSADFVQVPVRPEPQDASPWIAGHYSDEFTEAHAKGMVVRDALGAALPAAGVGCGFSRQVLAHMAEVRGKAGDAGPFAADCLTEDYELGLLVSQMGGRSRFLRLRDERGALVATRSYFPATLPEAVRQKTRWTHGIAFQGWDRLGWGRRPVDIWMSLRDRRGPLTALVLAAAYLLIVIDGLLLAAASAGWVQPVPISPELRLLLVFSFVAFAWRAVFRFAFTTREYGLAEGLRAVLRIPVGNVIAIMAGRRAFLAYIHSLKSGTVRWDKTAHRVHPAHAEVRRIALSGSLA